MSNFVCSRSRPDPPKTQATGPDTARIEVALAGNPNSGKTTIFNNLTGARQHVGNYPGVTVERKQGTCRHRAHLLHITDLPGTYGLTAHSLDERVARDFIIEQKPHVVVSVVDSSNLERNLYLVSELLELGVRLVLLLNMSDMAKARGTRLDLALLSDRLGGVPIVEAVGSRNVGTQELLAAVVQAASRTDNPTVTQVDYGREIEEEIRKTQAMVEAGAVANSAAPARWLAVKLLEGDPEVASQVLSPDLLHAANASRDHIEAILGDHTEVVMAERRYGFVSGLCQGAVHCTVEARHTASDRVDSVLASRALGLPIFFGLMYLVFHLTFTLGDPAMGWIESAFQWLGGAVSAWWPAGSDSAVKSLLVDGIIGGAGGVVVFLPNILLLFLAIAFLEDTGYMARAAFVMDRVMHAIGLQGRSFIPMLIGFGCSVPAIMATRTIANRRDRLTTILVTPLMSCGARLPIYALVIPAFFPTAWRSTMLFAIYLIGVALDLGSKEAAFHYARPGVCTEDGCIRVVDLSWFQLNWNKVENSGGMFGVGQGSGLFLRYFRLLALVVVMVFFVTAKPTQRLFLTALSLIGAGAVGNLYDSFFNAGKVRDFIEVHIPVLPWRTFNPWPNFNVADSLILIGAGFLVLVLLKDAEFGKKKSPPEETAEAPKEAA